uniref:Uncharacterized protein n=1 Tax=Nelumbo nucifera TaxID=4432 RepID=A0A822YQY4_NELNU|nr:TPA_asm: hypothetical protein HUJ06_005642 [Nelumbo nucifera]
MSRTHLFEFDFQPPRESERKGTDFSGFMCIRSCSWSQ